MTGCKEIKLTIVATRSLYSMNEWIADGVNTIWNITFSDGYLNKSYVKAFSVDLLGGQTPIPVVPSMFIGPFQLNITPPVPNGHTLRIYRDTPKNAPLVDFVSGADLSELNLDIISRQAVDIAAEVLDGSGFLVTDEFGFKALRRTDYTGSSTVQLVDNGRAHAKPTGGGVTIPDSLPDEFLTTIINTSLIPINLLFTGGVVAVLQGGSDPLGSSAWVLPPRQGATIHRIKTPTDIWLISGKVS